MWDGGCRTMKKACRQWFMVRLLYVIPGSFPKVRVCERVWASMCVMCMLVCACMQRKQNWRWYKQNTRAYLHACIHTRIRAHTNSLDHDTNIATHLHVRGVRVHDELFRVWHQPSCQGPSCTGKMRIHRHTLCITVNMRIRAQVTCVYTRIHYVITGNMRIHMHTHTCIHICICIFIHIYMCTCKYVYTYRYMYICLYMRIIHVDRIGVHSTYIYIYIYLYIYIYS